jgi:hypothetical protein
VPASPPVYHVELLATEPRDIPENLRGAVGAVCASLATVRAVYACRLRQESLDGEVTESVQLAIEPLNPREERGREPLPAGDMRRLFAALAPSPGEGLAFPSGRGIEAWRTRGVCLYRHDGAVSGGGSPHD